MNKLVYESLNEFGKGNNPLDTLGIGKTSFYKKEIDEEVEDWFDKIIDDAYLTDALLDDTKLDLFNLYNYENKDLYLIVTTIDSWDKKEINHIKNTDWVEFKNYNLYKKEIKLKLNQGWITFEDGQFDSNNDIDDERYQIFIK